MNKKHYETPKAMLSLFAAADVIAASGDGTPGGNIWDGDTVIQLPPVKLP